MASLVSYIRNKRHHATTKEGQLPTDSFTCKKNRHDLLKLSPARKVLVGLGSGHLNNHNPLTASTIER